MTLSSSEPLILARKPLVETIFELRWALAEGSTPGMQRDPGFSILLGRFYDRVQEKYPFIEELPIRQVPEELTPYAIRHRFRAKENGWPLTQLGPGILSVNETDAYAWDTFRPRVSDVIRKFFASYPNQDASAQPTRLELKYLNAIPFDYREKNLRSFIEESLQTTIRLNSEVFDTTESADDPKELNLAISYSLKRPSGKITIVLSTGTHKSKPALIFQLFVRCDANVPQNTSDIETWVEQAHGVIKEWFLKICSKKLLEEFA